MWSVSPAGWPGLLTSCSGLREHKSHFIIGLRRPRAELSPQSSDQSSHGPGPDLMGWGLDSTAHPGRGELDGSHLTSTQCIMKCSHITRYFSEAWVLVLAEIPFEYKSAIILFTKPLFVILGCIYRLCLGRQTDIHILSYPDQTSLENCVHFWAPQFTRYGNRCGQGRTWEAPPA